MSASNVERGSSTICLRGGGGNDSGNGSDLAHDQLILAQTRLEVEQVGRIPRAAGIPEPGR